jgi:formate hydrogenlyase subunit 6/NADH:ubiquinone oxidoreductase subunit I
MAQISNRILIETVEDLFKKPFTVLYPNEHIEIPKGFRGAPEVNPALCTVCLTCEKVCPSHCISIVQIEPDELSDLGISPEKGKPFRFSINLGQCLRCSQCQESCPVGRKGQPAISLNPDRWRQTYFNPKDAIETKIVYRGRKEK